VPPDGDATDGPACGNDLLVTPRDGRWPPWIRRSCRLVAREAEEAVRLVERALSLARGGVVGPIVSRARSARADMMAVDEISAARIAQLLHDAASGADCQE
jgi:hypothetical protein